MGNSPFTTVLDRGGAHGRRDIVRNGSRTELWPAGFLAVDSGSELADSRTVMEPNRKSTADNAPESSYSYSSQTTETRVRVKETMTSYRCTQSSLRNNQNK